MKRICFMAGLIILSSLTSCDYDDSPIGNSETVTELSATQEQSSDTRTSLGQDGSVTWGIAEPIKVFCADKSAKFVSTNSSPAATALFKGSLEVKEGYVIWAVYPYDSDATYSNGEITATISPMQTAEDWSFADRTNVTIARTTGTDLTFYNVCGGICFSVKHSGIKSVTFEGLNNENIAGKAVFSFSNGVPVISRVVDGQKKITLSAPNGETLQTGTNYFIMLLPGTLSKGYKMTFSTGHDGGALVNPNAVTVKRRVFGELYNVDEDLNFDTDAEPEYVDLGLSVKWATFNVGASKPEDYGDYFAWGATETYYEPGYSQEDPQQHWKDGYSDGYIWANAPYQTEYLTENDDYEWTRWSKYLGNSYSYYKSSSATASDAMKNVLDPDDDVAHVLWGDKWRMPTEEDFEELCNNCSHEWTTLNGVKGIRFTSMKPGYSDKWIFLPASGRRVGDYIELVDTNGYYWYSDLYTNDPYRGREFAFSADLTSTTYVGHRCLGHSVRPVYGK